MSRKTKFLLSILITGILLLAACGEERRITESSSVEPTDIEMDIRRFAGTELNFIANKHP